MDTENKLVTAFKKSQTRSSWLHLLTVALILEKSREETDTNELVAINKVIELLNNRKDLHDEEVSEIVEEADEVADLSNLSNEL